MSGRKRKPKSRQQASGGSRGVARPDATAAAQIQKPDTDTSESRIKGAASIGLASLAVIGDIVGISQGPRVLQISLGILSVVVGLGILIFCRRVLWLAAPRLTSLVLVLAGVAIVVIGLIGWSTGNKEERRSALAPTCSAASDYQESFAVASTLLAASGKDNQQLDQADKQEQNDLKALSEASDRSGSAEAPKLVYDMRVQVAAATGALNANDLALSVSRMMASWRSFLRLSKLCATVGNNLLDLTNPATAVIPPSVGAACRHLGVMIDIIHSIKGQPSADQKNRFYANQDIFLYHAINASDRALNKDVQQYLSLSGSKSLLTNGVAPIYFLCTDRGYAMPPLLAS